MRISKERGKRTPRSFFRGRALSQVRLSFIPGPRLSRLLSSLPSADEPQMCLKCICCAAKSPFVPQVALKCILKSDPERIRATFPFEMHEKPHRQGQKWPSEGRNLCAIDTFQREMWQSDPPMGLAVQSPRGERDGRIHLRELSGCYSAESVAVGCDLRTGGPRHLRFRPAHRRTPPLTVLAAIGKLPFDVRPKIRHVVENAT